MVERLVGGLMGFFSPDSVLSDWAVLNVCLSEIGIEDPIFHLSIIQNVVSAVKHLSDTFCSFVCVWGIFDD